MMTKLLKRMQWLSVVVVMMVMGGLESVAQTDTTQYITMVTDSTRTINLELTTGMANTQLVVKIGDASGVNVTVNWGDTLSYAVDSGEVVTLYGAVEGIDCGNNSLVSLDVSHNTLLTRLWCTDNKLMELDLTNNSLLSSVGCTNNRLTALDVSENWFLSQLSCNDNPNVGSLNLTNCGELFYLDCRNCGLTALDLSGNIGLYWLMCGGNSLTALDVSGNMDLNLLWVNDNELDSLDVSGNMWLEKLRVENNNLSGLDLSANMMLNQLRCGGNNFSVTAWDELYCSLVAQVSDAPGLLEVNGSDLAGMRGTNGVNLSFKYWKLMVWENDEWSNKTSEAVGTYRCSSVIAPIVMTMDAEVTEGVNAMLNGSVEYIYGDVDSCGYEWRKVGEEAYNNVNVGVQIEGYLLEDLMPYTEYEYRVYAAVEDSVFYGETVYFMTLLGGVNNVVVEDITTHSATVRWEATAGQLSWQVKLSGVDGGEVAYVYDTEEMMYSFEDLDAGMNYSVAVRGVNGAQYGEWSEEVEFATQEEPDEPEGIEEVVEMEMSVYPNPAEGEVKVKMEGVGGWAELTVTDVNGRVVKMERMMCEGGLTMDVDGWNEGVYFVKVVGEDWMMVKRLLVR